MSEKLKMALLTVVIIIAILIGISAWGNRQKKIWYQGYSEGKTDGYETGYEQGYEAGYDDGYYDGLSE